MHFSTLRPSTLDFPGEIIPEQATAVLVVVAIDAEVFPVAAVRRVVVVVAVLVVHGEQVEIRRVELTCALGANPAVDFQRAGAITVLASARAAHQFLCARSRNSGPPMPLGTGQVGGAGFGFARAK